MRPPNTTFDVYRAGALPPAARFSLVLFNDDVLRLGDEPVAGTPDQVERALGRVADLDRDAFELQMLLGVVLLLLASSSGGAARRRSGASASQRAPMPP